MNKDQLEVIKYLLSTMNLKVAEINKLERLAFQDAPTLIAEVERLQQFEQKAIYTIEENKRLREALKFYANDDNYNDTLLFGSGHNGKTKDLPPVNRDGGNKAREALENK